MKRRDRLFVIMVAVTTLLMLSVSAWASKADRRIESTARQTYIFKTFLRGDDIKIESRDGDVTLTGVVADNFNKSLAEETLAGISGVNSVDNRLEIKGAPPSENSDAWILDKVKGTLLFHRSVNAAKTVVDVQDGIVTLRGEATSDAQKDLTAQYARDVDGVKDVRNEMTVIKPSNETRTIGRKIDDVSINTQVKLSLLYHRSTSSLHVGVETKHGVVTLYGKAKNAAEKDLAAKYAGDVNGVAAVKNRMTVQ